MASCTDTYGLTGTDFSSDSVNFGVPVMMFFVTKLFSMTDANVVLYEKLMEQVRQKKAFPIPLTDLTKNHEESTKVTHPSKRRVKTMKQKRRYTATVDTNFCVAKELTKFDGFVGGVLVLSDRNKIWGYHSATDVNKGIPVDFVEIEGVDTPNAQGDDIPTTKIMFDIKNVDYMTAYGFIKTIDQPVEELMGITPVSIVATAGKTNTATKLYVDVYSDCGEGCELATSALTAQCFESLKGTAVSAGSITSIAEVEGAEGSYEITGTGFANDQTIGVIPWITGMTYTGYPYETPTPLVVAGIV